MPAPRTALAEVTLTVPGEHDKAYLGLYTLVEPVDQAFLKDRFHSEKGLLVAAAGTSRPRFPGRRLGEIPRPVSAAGRADAGGGKRLIEFVRLVQQGNDEQFRKEIRPRTSTSRSSCDSWPSRR